MKDSHIKYQALSTQEALAIEREIEAQIQYAFLLGMRAQAVRQANALTPLTRSTH